MDINTLRGLSSVLVLVAFIGICWWAFSPKRRKRFDEAANLPFADEPHTQNRRKDKGTAAQATSSEKPPSTSSQEDNTASQGGADEPDKKQV